jgi:hypothetical protein
VEGDPVVSQREFVQSPPKRRGRPPKVRPVVPEPDGEGSAAALGELERMDNAPLEQARAEVEALRERLRGAHAPVPSIIRQLRVLRELHRSELNRAAQLPFGVYGVELGANTIVHPLQTKISEAQAILDGKVHADFEMAAVATQLERLAKQIERVRPEDATLIDEIRMTCARAEEWPSVVVRLMGEIRELIERLAEVRRRRGVGATVHASGIPIEPRPETGPGPNAITEFPVH